MLVLGLMSLPLAAAAQPADFVSTEEGKAIFEEREAAEKALAEKKAQIEAAKALGCECSAAEAALAMQKPKGPVDGWTLKLQVGINYALSDSRDVPGIEDGTTHQLGATVKGSADLRLGLHEWRNSLDITHSRTSAPPLNEFIKSTDEGKLRSMYLYHLEAVPWLGPFARFRASTQLFPGELLLAADAEYSVDGGPAEPLAGRTSLELTSAFEPLLLRESIGVFANPIDDKLIELTISLGGGAQQIITQGGRAVADDDTTPVIEIVSLNDSTQIGIELEVEAEGALTETVTYGFLGNVLYPLYTDPEQPDLEGLEKTNVDVGLKVGVKLAKWASLDYVLSAKYLPTIIDEWQMQNSLLLNASFNLL